MAAKKKAQEPTPIEVEGFTTKDYEGLALLVCDRCGFDTFNVEAAGSHTASHAADDAQAAAQAELTEHLAERAQLTTEGTVDEG